MTGNKKIFCKVSYKEMRSDNLNGHIKQHSRKIKSYPVTNISVTNNVNNAKLTVLTQRSEEENEIKDENNLKVHVKVNETRGGSKHKYK